MFKGLVVKREQGGVGCRNLEVTNKGRKRNIDLGWVPGSNGMKFQRET